MHRTLLTTTLAALLALVGSSADAGNRFGINIGGVKINGGGGAVKIKAPGLGHHVIKPPVVRPPVVRPPKPPVFKPHPPVVRPPVIKPRPPVYCPPKPPVVHPPIVVHPPKPPVVCPPPVVYPKPPVVCPPPVVVTPPPVVHPPVTPPTCHCQGVCHCQPAPTNPWYFGMACERVQTPFGTGLRVAVVTPGGPAQTYGVKVGDVLLVAGTVNLSQATSNQHGASLVQSAVSPEGQVQLTLVDSSTGMLANLSMAPTPRGLPAPTGGPVALNPAQPTSTM